MQVYDIIMLIVLAVATILGAIKGFAWQVASLASVVISYIVAYRFRFEVGEMIQARPPWNQFLAMLILYVGTSFCIWVGFRLFSGMIDRVRLKEFDRHLGAAFGLAKGLIFCLLITMFAMSLLGPSQQSAICQSRSGFYIAKALDHGMGVLPQEIHDVVGPYLASLDEKLNDGVNHPAGGEPGSGESAWPFDSALNQQLDQLQIPKRLTELVPVPSNLATPNPGASSPGASLPSNRVQPAPNNGWPAGSQTDSPYAGSPNPGSGQFSGGQFRSGQIPSNQFPSGLGFGNPANGASGPQQNAPRPTNPAGPANQLPSLPGNSYSPGGSYPDASQYPRSNQQQAQQPPYVLPR